MPATLTFDDEFNTLSLWNGTSGTWSTTTAYVDPMGNGSSLPSNGEQEWYINANYAPTASVKPWTVNNGVLTISANKVDPSIAQYLGYTDPQLPPMGSYQYTSGLIETNHTFSQTYGYFEMKAQLPAGQGIWPAFWLMPTNGSWPPELDIMEVLGRDPTTLWTTAHTLQTGTHTSEYTSSVVSDMSTGYHTYAVDWEADKITWYFDDKPVFQAPTPADFNSPMYMIINLALGGSWGGNVDSTTKFPANMNVDYVRVWNSNPYTYTPEGSTGAGQSFTDTSNTSLVGTSGDDTFHVSTGGGETLTGGTGHDTYVFGAMPWVGNTITDFKVGSDKLDLHALYPKYTGSDPIGAGFVVLAQDGHGGYDVLVNPDGQATAANPWPTFVVDLPNVTDVGLTSANLLVNGAQGQTAASTFSLSNTFQVAADGTSSVGTVSPPPPTSPPPTSPPPPPPPPPPTSTSYLGTSGADTMTGSIGGGETMTGGAGNDVFVFKTVPWVGDHITDFTPGADKLDFSALFAASNYAGADPVADGYVKLYDDGSGTWVIYDTDGKGTADQWGTSVVHLDGIAAGSLNSAALFGGSGGTVSPPPPPPPPASPPPPPPTAPIQNVDPASLPLSGSPVNTITSGRHGVLFGTSKNDLLDGHGAYHTMNGAGGDDTFAVYVSTDSVNEKSGQGIDTVWSFSSSYTLATNVENGVLKGTGPQSLIGNTLNNDLRSNDFGSTLSGGAGNDILHAGRGPDLLIGGTGNDVFEFSRLPTTAGHVADFTPGSDVLDLRGLFAAVGYTGVNPLADGHLLFQADGAGNTQVLFDADGSAGSGAPVLVTTLDHVTPAALTPGHDWVFA